MFCAASAFGISWQHLNHSNLSLRTFFRFHVCFYIQVIRRNLHQLKMFIANLEIPTLKELLQCL